jgi:peptide/nickel transport system substrate-binding protein
MNPLKEDDVATGGWGADWANASTVIPDLFLQHGGFDMNLNWNDPTYKSFATQVATAQGETDRAKQAGEWKTLAQFVMDQYWTIKPVFQKEQNVWGSKVGGAAFWMPQGCLLFPALYVIQ